MTKRIGPILLLLLLAGPASAQHKLSLPPEVHGLPGKFIAVTADTPATSIIWITAAEDHLDVFPLPLADPKSTVVVGDVPGKYKLWCVATIKDVQAKTYCWIIIDGPAPPPGPTPPGPVPPGPAPIPTSGLRVLIVVDKAKDSALPKEQIEAINSQSVRSYLASHCAKGPDGTPEYRVWPANVDAGGESKTWQDAYARPRSSVPWVLMSNGTAGYEGPLPADINSMLVLLKKYGGA